MRAFAKYLPIVAILGTASLHADSAPPAPAPAPAAAAPDAPPPPKPMTAAEMNLDASRFTAESSDVLQTVLAFKTVAQKKKDVIKVNCVNDKLIQLKAQMNIEENTSLELQTALGKNSDDRVAVYSRLSSTHASITQLKEDARACIGEAELYKQEAGTTVDHPLLPDDPTVNPFPTLEPTLDPPGYASPFN